MRDARDQVAGFVGFRAAWSERDDGATEVAADCDAGGGEGGDVDVFPVNMLVLLRVMAYADFYVCLIVHTSPLG